MFWCRRGHAIGASGAILTTRLLHSMTRGRLSRGTSLHQRWPGHHSGFRSTVIALQKGGESIFEGFDSGRIAVDGVEIAYVATGAGESVRRLHGFPQTKALWARIAPELVALGYRVICADLRGYGASDKPPA